MPKLCWTFCRWQAMQLKHSFSTFQRALLGGHGGHFEARGVGAAVRLFPASVGLVLADAHLDLGSPDSVTSVAQAHAGHAAAKALLAAAPVPAANSGGCEPGLTTNRKSAPASKY